MDELSRIKTGEIIYFRPENHIPAHMLIKYRGRYDKYRLIKVPTEYLYVTDVPNEDSNLFEFRYKIVGTWVKVQISEYIMRRFRADWEVFNHV